MDAVILAAGRGTRLNGIAAPFHKPLLVVNGAPLVKTAVDLSGRVGAQRCIIVAAPENAAPINHVAPGWARMVIQRHPIGPGLALREALDLVTSKEVLVLLADNVLKFSDLARVVELPGNVVGVEKMDGSDAERFTRVRRLEDGSVEWVEKTPVTAADLDADGMATCWVGPVKMKVAEIRDAIAEWMREDPPLKVRGTGNEVPLGPLFNALTNVQTVPVQSYDIGVPEALA